MLPEAVANPRTPEPPTYRFSQYDILMRKVFAGCRLKRSCTSPRKDLSPSAESYPCRPWFHTANSVDPGAYSQRNTTFDWSALKLNPPGLFVSALSANSV